MKYCLKAESVYKEKYSISVTMKQEVCLLPVRCVGCKCVFDLWHDLQHEQEAMRQSSGFRRLVNQSLCWHCRGVLVGSALVGEDETAQEEPEESQTELSASFAYEV